MSASGKTKISAESFCLLWQSHNGDADAVATKLGQARGTIVARYKKYKAAGINLCDIKVKIRSRQKLSDIVPHLNKLLEQAQNNGH
jgi:hypothetical protein